MQKNSQNIINLYQVLNIQTLQVVEPKKEKKVNNSIYYTPPCDFSKRQDYSFKHYSHILWF
jgi:hypothetical protein